VKGLGRVALAAFVCALLERPPLLSDNHLWPGRLRRRRRRRLRPVWDRSPVASSARRGAP